MVGTLDKKLRKLFGPYRGRNVDFLSGEPQAKDVLCVVSRLRSFQSLSGRMTLENLGALVDRYYALMAHAAMQTDGDVNRFCGASVVCHYGVLQHLELVTIIPALEVAFRTACDLLRREFEVQVGIGICFGTMLCGRLGSSQRLTFTAIGPPAICSEKLSDRRGLNICEELAARIRKVSRPQDDPWISICPHWKPGPADET
jgi:class 3 adenylate cyclase